MTVYFSRSGFFIFIFSRAALIATFTLALAACDKQEQEDSAENSHEDSPEVLVVTLNAQDLPIQTQLAGRVSALRTADVRPQVRGIIEKRVFEEGADVKAGDILFHINDTSYAAAVAQAQANLGAAQAGLSHLNLIAERYQKLALTNNISRHDLEIANANYQQGLAQVAASEAALKTAQIDLQRTRIRAPIAGRIGRSLVTEGSLVSAEQENALAKIQQLDSVYVDIVQSNQQITELKLRKLNSAQASVSLQPINLQPVSLLLEGGQTYPHKGTLKFTDINVDTESGMVALRAQFSNPDTILLPGMFVRATLTQDVAPKALLVPQQAVSYNEKNQAVAWVVNAQQEVEQRQLELNGNHGNQWIVRTGLAAGERVIVEGSLRVSPGIKVIAQEQAPISLAQNPVQEPTQKQEP